MKKWLRAMRDGGTNTRKPQPISRLRLAARLPTGTRLNDRSVWLISILPDPSSKSIRVQLNPCRRQGARSRTRLLSGSAMKAIQPIRLAAGACDKARPTLFRYRAKAQGCDRATRLSVVRGSALAVPDNLHKPSSGYRLNRGSVWLTLRACKLKPTNDQSAGFPEGQAG